jgi:DNA-directed RNA polymerase specialized sigma24 family protein
MDKNFGTSKSWGYTLLKQRSLTGCAKQQRKTGIMPCTYYEPPVHVEYFPEDDSDEQIKARAKERVQQVLTHTRERSRKLPLKLFCLPTARRCKTPHLSQDCAATWRKSNALFVL